MVCFVMPVAVKGMLQPSTAKKMVSASSITISKIVTSEDAYAAAKLSIDVFFKENLPPLSDGSIFSKMQEPFRANAREKMIKTLFSRHLAELNARLGKPNCLILKAVDEQSGKNFANSNERRAWLIRMNGGYVYGNSKQGDDHAGSFGKGDRLGVLVDLDLGVVRFFKNGVKHGPGFEAGSLTGPVVPAVQMRTAGSSVRLVPFPMGGAKGALAEAVPPGVREEMAALERQAREQWEQTVLDKGWDTVAEEEVEVG